MSLHRTVSIQLPTLSDHEARQLLDVLHDLTAIVDAYYRPPPATSRLPPVTAERADTRTRDLFDDELPF